MKTKKAYIVSYLIFMKNKEGDYVLKRGKDHHGYLGVFTAIVKAYHAINTVGEFRPGYVLEKTTLEDCLFSRSYSSDKNMMVAWNIRVEKLDPK